MDLSFASNLVYTTRFSLSLHNLILVSGDLSDSNISEVNKPYLVDIINVTYQAALTEDSYNTFKQTSKSLALKQADNAMIAILIGAGLVPSNTVEIAEGTENAVSIQLLALEIADPTDTVVADTSATLDRIGSLIRRLGGTPDDAIIHIIP
jgi:hypothetical protein